MKKQTNINKEEKIKKLTWKYFIQQKCKEIGKFLLFSLGIALAVVIFHYSGSMLCHYDVSTGDLCNEDNFVLVGMFTILVMVFGLGIPIALCYLIFVSLKGWIISNWERANARASDEVNKIQKV